MKYSFFLLLFLAITNNIFGQCCSAGNPVGGDGSNDGLSKNELRIFTSYKHSLSKDFYHLDSKISIPYIQKSYFDYTNFSLTYGLFSRLSLHAELGYFINKTQDLKIQNQNEVISSRGLGDLTFNLRYLAVKKVKPNSQLLFSAGLRLPIGAFNEEIDGVKVPISLQPSSGATKYNASVFYIRKRSEKKYGLTSLALIELSQTINKGYLIQKYGNYFQFAIAGTYAITKNFNFIANAKLEWRGKDSRENQTKIESTGSKVVFFNPQLIFNFKKKWGIIVMSDIPIYKYVNGYQLTNKFSLQLGVRKSFFLIKSSKIL